MLTFRFKSSFFCRWILPSFDSPDAWEKCVVPLKEVLLSACLSCLIHSWSIWDIDQVVCGKMKINHRPTNIKDKLLACFIQLINLATVRELPFSNSLIIHAEKTKEITTVKEVWICDLNYHKIWWTFALIFSKNY